MIEFYADTSEAEQTMSGMRLNSIPKATIPVKGIEHTVHPAYNFSDSDGFCGFRKIPEESGSYTVLKRYIS
ncbi:MAG: hypothetical protein C5S47_02025 [Candidatus Methanogasteraceae archaeon]|nr:MAG: hypothetical protein C5S47_02025 [ANME-2 cluster archaeon]